MGNRRDGHQRARVGAGAEPARLARAADACGAPVHEPHLRVAGGRARPGGRREPRRHVHHRALADLGHRAYASGGRARSPGGSYPAARGGNAMKQALTVLAAALCIAACSKSGSPATGLTIAVIPKGTTHEFWKSIHAGAVQASQELSAQWQPVTIIWKGPLREDDREQQVQVVEGFLSQGVQGIVLAPLDNVALVRPVEEARRAGVPTVIIDSGLETDSTVSFVATDNYKGGQMAADRLGVLLNNRGAVLLLRSRSHALHAGRDQSPAARRHRGADPDAHGVPRRENDGGLPARQAGRAPH